MVPCDGLENIDAFRIDKSDRDGTLGEISRRAVSTRIEYGVEIRGRNLGAALARSN
jgi:hypothetical protein